MEGENQNNIKGGVVNISDVIQQISTIDNGVINIIKTLAKDISKIETLDTKAILNGQASITKTINSLRSYMSLYNDFLDTIVNSSSLNTKSINTILDYYEEYDPKEPTKVIKSEMRLLTSISLVTKFITDISKSIDSISKIKLPITGTIKIRKNILQLGKYLDLIVSSMIDVFGKDNTATLKSLMDVLAPSPETVELFSDVKKNILDEKKGDNSNFIDESYDKSHTITTKSRIGLLDAITIYLGFAQTITSLPIPKVFIFKLKLNSLNKCVEDIIKSMGDLVPMIGSKKHVKAFEDMNSSLSEIRGVFRTLSVLANSITDFSIKSLIIYKLAIKALDKFIGNEKVEGILPKILIIRNRIENDWTQFERKPISNLTSYITSLAEILKVTTSLSILAINPLLYMGLRLLVGKRSVLDLIAKLAEKLNDEKFDALNDENLKNRLNNIVEFTTSLKKLAVSILLVSALAIVAVPAMLVVSLFILSLVPFILIVSLITKLIDRLDIKDIKESILSIVLVCGLFALVAVELVLLQLVLKPVKWVDLLIDLALLSLVVIALVSITWVISKIIEKMKNNLLGITMILAVVGLFLVVGVTLLALQYILAPIEWWSLLGGLIGLTLVTVALAGVCTLIGLSSVVFIAAIAGVVILLATIGAILLVAVMLKTLTLISFSEEDIKKLTAKPDDKGTGEYGVLTAVIKTIESIGDLLWESDFLNLGTLALVTIKFFIMTFTIGLLFIIAILLKAITKITLNVGVWNPTSTETDGTILGNISAIINIVGLINHHMTQPPVDENGNPVEQDKGLLGTIISWISPELGNLVSSLLNFATLVFTLMNVGCIYLIAGILMSIGELEVDEGTIMGKIDGILNIVRKISEKIMHRDEAPEAPDKKTEESKSLLSKIGGKLKGAIKSVASVAGDVIGNLVSVGVLATALPNLLILGQVVDVISSINELEVDESSITKKVDSIINIVNTISTKVSEDSKVSSIDEDKVESFEDFTDSNIKLYKGINELDIDKVTSLTKLYAQMTEFMNSIKELDLEEITDALVDKIGPALLDIKDTLNSEPKQTLGERLKEKFEGVKSEAAETNSEKKTDTNNQQASQNQASSDSGDIKEITQQLQIIVNALKNEGIIIQNLS